MKNPNFESMTRRELRDYMLANRHDEEAFRAYMDRLYALPNQVWHPAPKSVEDLSHFPQLLEEHQRRLEAERQKEQEGQD
jgi:hypothetical protein